MSHYPRHTFLMAITRSPAVWNYGEAFKNGKLYCFSPRRILVARPWPNLLAWVKTPCRPWRPTCRAADREIMPGLFPPGTEPVLLEPEGPLAPLGEEDERINREIARRHGVYVAFFDAIPEAERLEVLRFKERRWYLLNLFARCPGGLDLSRSNPAMAMALACNRAFHHPGVQRPYRAARSLLPKSQRDILAWLGFPPTEAVRRMLRKIPPRALTVTRLLTLRKRLEDPALQRLLAHLPVLHEGILQVVNVPRYRPLATAAFLGDLAKNDPNLDWHALLAQPLWETEASCRLLEEPFELPPLRSLDAFFDYHQAVTAPIGEAYAHRFNPHLPPPPFPGVPGIAPITTTVELFREGGEMEHCVASHLLGIQGGREAIYRVTHPIRATLSIRNSQAGWRLGQISGHQNAKVPQEITADLLRRLLGSGKAPPSLDE